MSRHSAIDRESFQTFLADAFAVQQSGLDAQSIAALMEIQHFIGSGELDLDGKMQAIADRVQRVRSASGVAIALIEGNELVYRSGSGRAAQEVGHRVPAVLSVSPSREMREILRVEDARNDTRIEAHICRQFGAMALLMLPIWKNQILVGVLQVLFDDAHSFQESEIRTYRLMVGALEHEMVQQPASTPAIVRDPEPLRDIQGAVETVQALESPTGGSGTVAEASVEEAQLAGTDPGSLAESGVGLLANQEEIKLRRSAFWWEWARALQVKVSRASRSDFRNAGAVVAAAVVLSVSLWIFHRTHSSNPRIGFAIPATHQTGEGTAARSLPTMEEPKGPVLTQDRNEDRNTTQRIKTQRRIPLHDSSECRWERTKWTTSPTM